MRLWLALPLFALGVAQDAPQMIGPGVLVVSNLTALEVEASQDLLHWELLVGFTNLAGTNEPRCMMIDWGAYSRGYRFYRVQSWTE